VAIRGHLSEASLPDVLQLLAMGNKQGALTITAGQLGGIICFDGGRICHASIAGRSLGTEESVFAMFKWNDGTFSFEPGGLPPQDARLVSLDAQALLLEGARRVDEWSLIEKKLPDFDVVFALDRHQLLRNSGTFTAEQQKLLPLIDGYRDVHEIMRTSGMGEFDTGKALYGLLSGSFLVKVGAREGEQPIVPESVIAEHRNLGIAFYRARMLGDAAREFRRITELRSSDASAAFYLGLIAVREARWNDAVTSFQRAAVSAPRSSGVLINMAYAYERLGQTEKARLAYEQVIARSSRPEPVAQLGIASLALQRHDLDTASKALAAARAGFVGTPPAAWFHYSAAEAALRGEPDRVMAILGEAVAKYPGSAILLNNLAVAQEACGNLEGARETHAAYQRAAAASAGSPR
jgi:tetratricopeptide (TPR) repeat protein